MSDDQANSIIVVSALVTAAIYFYRKITAATGAVDQRAGTTGHGIKGVLGVGAQAPLGRWLLGFGVTFFGLSTLALLAPGLAAALAGLVAVGAILFNGLGLAADVNGKLSS